MEYAVNMENMKAITVSSKKLPLPPIRLLAFNVLSIFNEKEKEQQVIYFVFYQSLDCYDFCTSWQYRNIGTAST